VRGGGLRKSQFGRLMRCCAANALSAWGESAGWLKPTLITLNWLSPKRPCRARTVSSRARVVVGQTWKHPV
jgi:hypothetical protein